MRMMILAAAAMLLMPAAAAAQTRSPFPDHWLTIDSLAVALGLSAEQQAAVSGSYRAINDLLRQAVARREELRASMPPGPVAQMTPEQRQALAARLAEIRTEYEARQEELDRQYAALRAQLTVAQQATFDALPRPRLVPQRPPSDTTSP